MIKEIKNRIVLNQKGEGIWETTLINGMLRTITVLPAKTSPLKMRVSTAQVIMLDESEIKKSRVFSPAIQPSTEDGHVFSQNSVPWALNDKLYFKLEGSKNNVIDIMIRWE